MKSGFVGLPPPKFLLNTEKLPAVRRQLTWLALDEDHVARFRRVEHLNALRGM
jgi:hypothetical protein